MPSTTSKISEIIDNYSQFSFEKADTFSWQPSDNTIYYNPNDSNVLILLLHEVSHALMGHKQYSSDIGLLKIEQETWARTVELANSLDVTVCMDDIQLNLDTYRDWMHERSKCPSCKSTGVQIKLNTYECPACNNRWKVNQAKECRLKRQNIKNAQ